MRWIIYYAIIIILIIVIVYLIKNRFYDMQISYFVNKVTDDEYINDVSQFNRTKVDQIFYPTSKSDIVSIVKDARNSGKHISIRGTKHSMGGQTITKNGYLIDT